MENKKTKLTISGNAKRSIKNIEFAKTKGKNSTVIEKSKSNFAKKGSFSRSSGNILKQKSTSSFNRGTPFKPSFGGKMPQATNDFECKLRANESKRVFSRPKSAR